MNIGFDLDKIFVNHPPLVSEKIIDKIYKHKHHGHLEYRIPSRPEQMLRRLTHYSPLRPAIKKNITFVQDLASLNTNKHYLISGRFGFLEQVTKQFAKKYNFDTIFDAMFFNFQNEQPHFFKDTIIKKLQLDKYIDDDLDLLEYLAIHNSKTIFFWLNQKLNQQLAANLFAITDLQYIL